MRDGPKILSVPETERAWAAGFFDGEGCTTITRCAKVTGRNGGIAASLRMSVAQVDTSSLARFFKAVGTGKIRGPYQYSTNKQPHWQWNASGMDCFVALDALWPYLDTAKREQALRKVDEYIAHLEVPKRVNQYDNP